MQVSIRYRERTRGIIRAVRQIEVIARVRFTEVETLIIQKRQLENFVVLKREPDTLRANRLALLGRKPQAGGVDLLVANLLNWRPDRFICDTPVHAKAYERTLVEALGELKVFITENATVSRTSTFNF